MLEKLLIQNFAIIDQLEIDFSKGFNVLTGETGAGKSIIVDAISMLLGGTANEGLIKAGAGQAHIQGVFTVNTANLSDFAYDFLEENSTQLIISRKIIKNKPSEAKVNNTVITIKKLKELTTHLISISGQHEHILLFENSYQQKLLDYFCGAEFLAYLKEYQQNYAEYLALKKDIEAAQKSSVDHGQQIAFLEFQIQDLTQNNFMLGEEDELKNKQKQAKYLHQIKASLSTANQNFEQIISQLNTTITAFNKLNVLNNSVYRAFEQRTASILIDTQDLAQEVSVAEQAVGDYDEAQLLELDNRLDLIFRYKSKYSCNSVDELIKLKERLVLDYNKITKFVYDTKDVMTEFDRKYEQLCEMAQRLYQIRCVKAEELGALINEHLLDLHFLHSNFKIMLTYDENNINNNGADTINFLISTNAGQEPRALASVASGGELSRIMLAIKTVFYELSEVETLILDEIDTGVGGLTALKIGEKIGLIAKKSQVLCVTHLPQIAKFAHHHFVIAKCLDATKQHTLISIDKLTDAERLVELERMVGGKEVLQLLQVT